MLAAAFDDDHRAVFQVADALPRLFARLDDADLDAFARQEHGLERIGDVVEVDDGDVVQLGDLVQVVVVGDELALEVLGQGNELQVDRLAGELGQVAVEDLQVDGRIGPQAVEDVEPAAAAAAAFAVAAVGDRLQFGDHELGHDQLLVEQMGFDHVGDPAVDDHARVEDARAAPLHLLGELDVGDDEAEVVLGLHQEADAGVAEHHGQQQLHDAADLCDQLLVGVGKQRGQGQAGHVGHEQPHDQAHVDRRDHVELLAADGHVEADHAQRQQDDAAEGHPGHPRLALRHHAGPGNEDPYADRDDDEHKSQDDQAHRDTPPVKV